VGVPIAIGSSCPACRQAGFFYGSPHQLFDGDFLFLFFLTAMSAKFYAKYAMVFCHGFNGFNGFFCFDFLPQIRKFF
jgi:hypothetical protein